VLDESLERGTYFLINNIIGNDMDSRSDDLRLQQLLDNSSSDDGDNEYWFSRKNQNKMVLNLAAKLYVAHPSISVEDSIKKAQNLVDTFYKMVLQKTTKQYKG
jgi:hypothetical protein